VKWSAQGFDEFYWIRIFCRPHYVSLENKGTVSHALLSGTCSELGPLRFSSIINVVVIIFLK